MGMRLIKSWALPFPICADNGSTRENSVGGVWAGELVWDYAQPRSLGLNVEH